LEAIRPSCFLDDVTTKNVSVENGALTGVVDFDVVCHGDPLFEIVLIGASVAAGFPARCAFYVRELTRLARPTQFQVALLTLYEAVFLTQFLLAGPSDDDSRGADRNVGESPPRQRGAVLRALTNLPRGSDMNSASGQEWDRIDRRAVHPHFEMQVRARRIAAGPD